MRARAGPIIEEILEQFPLERRRWAQYWSFVSLCTARRWLSGMLCLVGVERGACSTVS